jgi:hypothetical protein
MLPTIGLSVDPLNKPFKITTDLERIRIEHNRGCYISWLDKKNHDFLKDRIDFIDRAGHYHYATPNKIENIKLPIGTWYVYFSLYDPARTGMEIANKPVFDEAFLSGNEWAKPKISIIFLDTL